MYTKNYIILNKLKQVLTNMDKEMTYHVKN